MAGRGILFPVAMAVFFVAMIGWAATVPVEPASERPGGAGGQAQAGDVVLVELTQWYLDDDGEPKVFQSTQEDRHSSLPVGSVEPIFTQAPVRLTLSAPWDTLKEALVGQLPNVTFTTDRIPPEQAYGTWQEDVEFDRHLFTVPFEETLGEGGIPWDRAQVADLSEYRTVAAGAGIGPLEPGYEFSCEGPDRWQCRIVSIDESGNGSLTYRRLVEGGERYSLADFLGPFENAPGFDGNLTAAVSGEDSFDLNIEPVVGDVFQLRAGLGELLPAGTYRVERVEEEAFVADYAQGSTQVAGMIGRTVWFEATLVAIQRPATV